MNLIPKLQDIHNKEGLELVDRQKMEFMLLGTYLLTSGLTLYYYNSDSDQILEPEYEKSKDCIVKVVSVGDYDVLEVHPLCKDKIIVDCRYNYFEALNLKSARVRITKWQQGKIKSLFNLRVPSKENIKLW